MARARRTDLARLRLTRVITEVRRDPQWATATPDDQLTEVIRRLGEDATASFAEARDTLVADMETRLLHMIVDTEEPTNGNR